MNTELNSPRVLLWLDEIQSDTGENSMIAFTFDVHGGHDVTFNSKCRHVRAFILPPQFASVD